MICEVVIGSRVHWRSLAPLVLEFELQDLNLALRNLTFLRTSACQIMWRLSALKGPPLRVSPRRAPHKSLRHISGRSHARAKAPVPVIPQLAKRLDLHRKSCGSALTGPIFANSAGNPLDLNACYRREMKSVLKRAGITWHGWHGFRRGLASNLNRLGVDDSVIQRILRHSNVATTQNHYIKTASPDAIAAMKQFSQALMCSACPPDGDTDVQGTVQ